MGRKWFDSTRRLLIVFSIPSIPCIACPVDSPLTRSNSGCYRAMAPADGASASVGCSLAAGAAAGGFACLVASPLALLRTRQQVLSTGSRGACAIGHQHVSAQGGLSQLSRQEGLRGVYRGAAAQLGRGCSATSVQLATYDVVRNRLRSNLGECSNPRWRSMGEPFVTFGAAAVAQTVATVAIRQLHMDV